MPELPEVETVRRGLEAGALGKTILSAAQYRNDIRFVLPDTLSQRLQGQTINHIGRRGKYLLFTIGNLQLIGHLGMSGAFIVRSKDHIRHIHDHLVWQLDNNTEIAYHDPRRFGFILEATDGFDAHSMIAALGAEPLSNHLHGEYLAKKLYSRAAPIKNVLLDQSVIAGLGNIYVCELLYRCHINPARSAKECVNDVDNLVTQCRIVLEEAIASGGSTLRNYANASGGSGYFQHHFSVYGRQGQDCYHCATSIIRITQAGRSTFFCPQCQRG